MDKDVFGVQHVLSLWRGKNCVQTQKLRSYEFIELNNA